MVNSCSSIAIEEKRRQNSRAPISRLPPELLSLIFSNIRDDYLATLKKEFSLSFDDVGSEDWKYITHVCHGWREIALCTPTWWTRVVSSPDNNKWTHEMLLRSKRCPFTCIVKGYLDSRDSANGRMELIKQLGRCRTLGMREVPCHDLHKYWSPKVHAPQLEYLFIQVDEDDTSSDIPFILSDSHLHAPSLRSLEIEGCGIDWKSGLLSSSLTHLGLHVLPVDSLLECSELIKLLAKMPFLEDIDLSDDYIRDEDPNVPPLAHNIPTCLYWPRLRCLSIMDDVIKIPHFLSNITLPLSSKLHLRACETVHEAMPYVSLVLDWLSNHFKQPSSDSAAQNCIRSFVLGEFDDDFTMRGFNEVFYLEQEGREADALLQYDFIDFESEGMGFFSETLTNVVLPRLPFSSIVFLEVCIGGFYLSSSSWLTIFGSIPTLETICICISRPMPFFHALHPDSTDGRFVPFPALKSLGVVTHMYPPDYLAIVKILRQRTEIGIGLLEFVFFIHDSIPPFYAISQFMEVVPKVGIYKE